MNSFECAEAFITDQDTLDNAIVSLQNSSISFSKIEVSQTLGQSIHQNLH
jgi:hypothetical protein